MEQNNASKDIVMNDRIAQIVLVGILCLMSLQPLGGVTTHLIATNAEEWDAFVNNHFLMKSELIRYNGYVALLAAIVVGLMKEGMSIIGFLKKIYWKKPWNICFTFLLVWIFINVFTVSPFLDISLNGDPYRFEGLFSIVAYAGFFAAASLVQDEKLKKIWMDVSVASSTALGICAVHSLYAKNPIVLTYMNRQIIGSGPLMATFPQFNHYGYYLCVMNLLLAGLFLKEDKKRNKVVYAILFAFNQYVLALNGTRGSYLASTIALVFLSVCVLRRKDVKGRIVAILWGLAIIATLAASSVFFDRILFSLSEVSDIANNVEIIGAPTSGRNRFILWSNSIELIKLKPIVGFGLNTASYALAQIRGIWDMPHNEYLQHFVDLGVIGFLPYVSALLTLFASTMKKIKEIPTIVLISGCAVIAYAISAFFGVTIVEVIPFFYILLGFVKWEKPAGEEAETKGE